MKKIILISMLFIGMMSNAQLYSFDTVTFTEYSKEGISNGEEVDQYLSKITEVRSTKIEFKESVIRLTVDKNMHEYKILSTHHNENYTMYLINESTLIMRYTDSVFILFFKDGKIIKTVSYEG